MNGFAIGDLVEVHGQEAQRKVGIVSQPITDEGSGHVLTLDNGCVIGMPVSIERVSSLGEDATGFVQLAHTLIKLASHVIDRKLIV